MIPCRALKFFTRSIYFIVGFFLIPRNYHDFGIRTSACKKMYEVKLWWQTSNAKQLGLIDWEPYLLVVDQNWNHVQEPTCKL